MSKKKEDRGTPFFYSYIKCIYIYISMSIQVTLFESFIYTNTVYIMNHGGYDELK